MVGIRPEGWLQHYADFMLTPGRHRDTYVEECHRGFFTRYAQGKSLAKCGIRDEHIGGLAHVPALMAACSDLPLGKLRAVVKEHVGVRMRIRMYCGRRIRSCVWVGRSVRG